MSREATIQPTSGQGLVRLKDGRVYQGDVSYDGRAVRIDGRLQVKAASGTTYRKRRKLTVPLYRVHEIVWA